MGLKFKGSELIGAVPVVADIGVRELAINLIDKKIFSKNTAGVIVDMNGEIAGRLYAATDRYLLGDIVTDGAVPALAYISLVGTDALPNVGNPLPAGGGLNASWQELDSIFYIALSGGDMNGDGVLDALDGNIIGEGGGQHCPWDSTSGDAVGTPVTPNALGEYPNTALNATEPGFEQIGAVWYISGLGATDNVPHEYTFLAGNLAGRTVRDNDKIMWVDGVTGSEVWLWSPFPRISGERGGILFGSAREYVVGDLATFNNIVYQSLSGTPLVPNVGNQPDLPASVADWASISADEFGGVVYDPTHQYEIGDVFTYDGVLYIVGEDPLTPGVAPVPGALDPTDSVTNPEWSGLIPGGGTAIETSIDVGGWTSAISTATVAETTDGINPVSPANPVTAGTLKDVQTVLNIVDDFMDPGTY